MANGKVLRMKRLFDENNRTVIFPIDHGYPFGPICGIEDPLEMVKIGVAAKVNAFLLHQGILKQGLKHLSGSTGVIMRLSGATALAPDISFERIISSVEHAASLGADAVAVTVNLGNEHETEQLERLGQVAVECDKCGIVLLGEMMLDPKRVTRPSDSKYVAWAARVGEEAGSDFLKLHYTGSTQTFSEVTRSVRIPIVIAGGEKIDSDEEVLNMASGAISAGAAGVCFGRNVFQHENPRGLLEALIALVRENRPLPEVRALLRK